MNEIQPTDPLDADLRRLPRWSPPADFATRLSSAAARQSLAAAPAAAPSALERALDVASVWAPWVVAAALVGSVVTDLPWDSVVANAGIVAAVTVVAVAGVGLWMSARLLRTGPG
jgi:hypothetical protein